jgi:hypothetical protein
MKAGLPGKQPRSQTAELGMITGASGLGREFADILAAAIGVDVVWPHMKTGCILAHEFWRAYHMPVVAANLADQRRLGSCGADAVRANPGFW